MTRKHYHVLAGLQGCYMPDSNEVCENLDVANASADELAEWWAEDMELELTLYCPSTEHYWTVGPHHCVHVTVCDNATCMEDSDHGA